MQSLTHMDSWWCDALFESHPSAMAVVAADHRFVRCNSAFCRLTGYEASELTKRTWQSITHPDDLYGDQSGANAAQLSREHATYAIDKRYIKKNGNIVWITLHVRGVFDADKFLCYLVVAIPLLQDFKPAEYQAKPVSIARWARENPKDAIIVLLGAFIFLGRDAVIEIIKGILTK